MKYVARIEGKEFLLDVEEKDGRTFIEFGGVRREVDMVPIGGNSLFSVIIDGVQHEIALCRWEDRFSVSTRGGETEVFIQEMEKRRREVPSGRVEVKAPMPGLIVAVEVAMGQEVHRGQGLLVLEAMKMQNEIKSPKDGVVGEIQVKTGNTVTKGAVLLAIE